MIGEQLVLDIGRDNLVYQHNSLVVASYDMGALEQKLFLMLVSTIKKDDVGVSRTTFRVKDIAETLGITSQSLYRDLPKICSELMKKVIEIKQDDGSWKMFAIISFAQYKSKEGKLILEIHKEAEPYLLKLQEMFTVYRLGNVLDLKSKYSIRLYQQSKRCLFKGGEIIELKEFRKILRLDKKTYDRFDCITSKVLKPAIEEINNKTDIDISYETIKEGRKVCALKFNVKNKKTPPTRIVKRKDNIINPMKFNNFEAREYDWNSIENRLLGWDKE